MCMHGVQGATASTCRQEFREAFLNRKLVQSWRGGQQWAALDYHGLELSHSTASAHELAHDQASLHSLKAVVAVTMTRAVQPACRRYVSEHYSNSPMYKVSEMTGRYRIE